MKLRSLPPPLKPGFRHWQGIRWQCLGWPPPASLRDSGPIELGLASPQSSSLPFAIRRLHPSASTHSAWVAGPAQPL